jgi:hypothetical protein
MEFANSYWVVFVYYKKEIPMYVFDSNFNALTMLEQLKNKYKRAWICEMDYDLLIHYYDQGDKDVFEIFDPSRKNLNFL